MPSGSLRPRSDRLGKRVAAGDKILDPRRIVRRGVRSPADHVLAIPLRGDWLSCAVSEGQSLAAHPRAACAGAVLTGDAQAPTLGLGNRPQRT